VLFCPWWQPLCQGLLPDDAAVIKTQKALVKSPVEKFKNMCDCFLDMFQLGYSFLAKTE
jgi:hypothetical protein